MGRVEPRSSQLTIGPHKLRATNLHGRENGSLGLSTNFSVPLTLAADYIQIAGNTQDRLQFVCTV